MLVPPRGVDVGVTGVAVTDGVAVAQPRVHVGGTGAVGVGLQKIVPSRCVKQKGVGGGSQYVLPSRRTTQVADAGVA